MSLVSVVLMGCHDDEAGAYGIYEVELVDHSDGTYIADVHGDHWHGGIEVDVGEVLAVGFVFLDEDDEEIDIDLGGDVELDVGSFDDGIVSMDPHGDHIDVEGLAAGETIATFELIEDGESIYEFGEGAPVDVIVGD